MHEMIVELAAFLRRFFHLNFFESFYLLIINRFIHIPMCDYKREWIVRLMLMNAATACFH